MNNDMDNSGGVAVDISGEEDFSQINVNMDVIAAIAGKAAVEVEGVIGIDGGIAGGLAAAIGKESPASGVRALLEDNELIINVNIITRYGMRIPEMAWNLQEYVKKSVEDAAGIPVQKVNVYITGIKNKPDRQ